MSVANKIPNWNSRNVGDTNLVHNFILAVESGKLSNVQNLLERMKQRGISIDSTPEGKRSLSLAAQNGKLDIVRELLAHGANVNAATALGETPLMYAAQDGHLAVVSELLERGADVNAATSDTGSTSLMLAAEGGHIDTVSKLLEHHANVNVATTDTGSTPLILASWNGHKEIIRLLCQNGAHKNTINKDGRRAIDLAKTIEIKRILSESCPSVKPTETLPEGGYSRRPKTKRNRRNKRTKRIARK